MHIQTQDLKWLPICFCVSFFHGSIGIAVDPTSYLVQTTRQFLVELFAPMNRELELLEEAIVRHASRAPETSHFLADSADEGSAQTSAIPHPPGIPIQILQVVRI